MWSTTNMLHPAAASEVSAEVLQNIEERVLWLTVVIVNHANNVSENPSGLKVGCNQASSASMVSIMTALWFVHLKPEGHVSVKQHASPVLHAINYLIGELDATYLASLAVVTIVAMRTRVPEAVAAADRLTALGQPADVVCVTSPGLLFDAVQARRGNSDAPNWILETLPVRSRRAADGDWPGGPSACPGIPGRGARRTCEPPRRHGIRPIRRSGKRVSLPRHR